LVRFPHPRILIVNGDDGRDAVGGELRDNGFVEIGLAGLSVDAFTAVRFATLM
jgi:hypothetical protein